MNKFLLSIFLSIFCLSAVYGQKEISLNIYYKAGTEKFEFNKSYENNIGSKFLINRLDFYLTNVTFIHDGGMRTATDDYFLVAGEGDFSHKFGMLNIEELEAVEFSIGVDTPENHEDPTLLPNFSPLSLKSPSMHWGWSAGYRFICLEGKSGNSLNNDLQLHALWDKNFFTQKITTEGKSNDTEIKVNLDMDVIKYLENIDVNSGMIEHGDNKSDLKMIENVRDIVFTKSLKVDDNSDSTNTTDTTDNSDSTNNNASIRIAFHENEIKLMTTNDVREVVLVNSNKSNPITKVDICDLSGRKIKEVVAENNKAVVKLSNSGLYLISVYSKDNRLSVIKVSMY